MRGDVGLKKRSQEKRLKRLLLTGAARRSSVAATCGFFVGFVGWMSLTSILTNGRRMVVHDGISTSRCRTYSEALIIKRIY